MEIGTYFGFFATSVFTAFAGSLAQQTGRPVVLEAVSLAAGNGYKLARSEVETLLLPRFAQPAEPPFLFALSAADRNALGALGRGRVSLQRLVEQAAGCAVEPFHFIGKTRARLSGLRFSRNVTGLASHHLGGGAAHTMARGWLRPEGGQPFSLRLLVNPAGRDLIEQRAQHPHTQRALFAVNEGAYLCRPQWEPAAHPPGGRKESGLSTARLNDWVQAFFALNAGNLPPKVFQQPAALTSRLVPAETLLETEPGAEGVAVVRLLLNGAPELETIVLVPAPAEKSLLSLSKSGQPKFLGEFFRAFFGEAAGLWQDFGREPFGWRVRAVGRIPTAGLGRIAERVQGGGLAVAQEARLGEGRVRWLLAVSPAAWRALVLATARGMAFDGGDAPQPKAVFAAAGWGGAYPWQRLVGFCSDGELQHLIRLLSQQGVGEPVLAAVAAALEDDARQRWLAAMPVMLRERTENYQPEPDQPPSSLEPLAETLVELQRSGKIPAGQFSRWVALLAEMRWGVRQALLDQFLPLRHLIYGMDRGSLSRVLFDEKNDVLAGLLCWAEFPVVDQVRRAISPGYAVRLLEDIAVKRPRTTAYQCQQAQLTFYRRCHQGSLEGRYLLRATVAERLAEICRGLDALVGTLPPEAPGPPEGAAPPRA